MANVHPAQEGLDLLFAQAEFSDVILEEVLVNNKNGLHEFLFKHSRYFPQKVVSLSNSVSPVLMHCCFNASYGLHFFFNDMDIFDYLDIQPLGRGDNAGEHMGVVDSINIVHEMELNSFGTHNFHALINGTRDFINYDGKRFDVQVPNGYYVFKFEEQWAGGGQESDMSEKVLIFNISSAEEAFERFVHYCAIQSHKHYFQRVRMAVPGHDKWFWLPDAFSVKVFSSLEIGSMLSLPSEIIHT